MGVHSRELAADEVSAAGYFEVAGYRVHGTPLRLRWAGFVSRGVSRNFRNDSGAVQFCGKEVRLLLHVSHGPL